MKKQKIIKNRKNKAKNHHRTAVGIISISSKGTGYVKILNKTPTFEKVGVPTVNVRNDIEIDFRDLNTALHGDTVEIVFYPKSHERQRGKVIKIISRAKIGFSGVLNTKDLSPSAGGGKSFVFFLKPDDIKIYTDILIPEKELNDAKVGQKVYVKIISWKDPSKAPEGKVIKILGKPGDNDTEMYAIAIEKGFDNTFPKKVEEEAEKISIKEGRIKKEDSLGRRDFRKTLTFTIDPEDAKDFDDAVSFREINDNLYEIGIHIADVSNYVKVGSELDKEAEERGTSLYLVDRTIPMLPETLSNDLCSLLPYKDRLTMSAVFDVDKNANVKKSWFGKTIIHSQKRFSYEEAERVIKDEKTPFHREFFILNNLAKKLTKERFKNGAISLEQEEVKFVLDKDGRPLKIIKKERGDSNKLIEEFMLLANRKVAETITLGHKPHTDKEKNTKNEKSVFVYRVHDNPSKEKMADLAFFLKGLGYKISLIDGVIPTHEINKLLKDLSGKNEEDTVQRAIVRSMAKAIYSTENIGHYGLAFQYYTHFTSPIRRYPDIVVHRLLNDFLIGKKIGKEKLSIYEKISTKSSEREKYASDAERASIKYKQVEYMSSHIGKTFKGIISGIKEWGLYVEEIETKCEGLVRTRDLEDDFYVFDEKKLELVGQRNKKRYRLGDEVKIKVKNVDLERKTIDYVLI